MTSKRPHAPPPAGPGWEPLRDVLEAVEQIAAAGWYPARRELMSRLASVPRPDLPVWVPEADVEETPGEVTVSFALPDVEKEDIRLSVTEDTATVRGRRSAGKDGRVPDRAEQPRGEFLRRVRLPVEVKPASARAVYRNGILRLTLARARAAAAGRSVKIE